MSYFVCASLCSQNQRYDWYWWNHRHIFIFFGISGFSQYLKLYCKASLNTLASGRFRVFREKNTETHVAFYRNFSGPVSATDLVKSSKDASSLVACTRKSFFWLGVQIFCEWHHNWRTFRPPWPTSPFPGPKPLDGSISLKFLLETRLQSKSFDTLDDLLGFQVQSYDLN